MTAQAFVLMSIPKAYFLGMFDLTKLYLGCFESTVPAMVSQLVASLLHAAWLHLLVIHYELGISGIALASLISTLTMFGSVLAYMRYLNADTCKAYHLSS